MCQGLTPSDATLALSSLGNNCYHSSGGGSSPPGTYSHLSALIMTVYLVVIDCRPDFVAVVSPTRHARHGHDMILLRVGSLRVKDQSTTSVLVDGSLVRISSSSFGDQKRTKNPNTTSSSRCVQTPNFPATGPSPSSLSISITSNSSRRTEYRVSLLRGRICASTARLGFFLGYFSAIFFSGSLGPFTLPLLFLFHARFHHATQQQQQQQYNTRGWKPHKTAHPAPRASLAAIRAVLRNASRIHKPYSSFSTGK